MNNKELYKLLKISKANSGFTLIELLVGLFMSIFVIGALGFGLVTVLQANQSENSKIKARTENSRALDFISDEVRRAKTIETNLVNARVTTSTTDKTAFNVTDTNINVSTRAFNSDTTTKKKIVFALDIPEVSFSNSLDADNNVSTPERIIYFLKSSSGTNWKAPSVLYRWGPPLDADGNYTTGDWTEQALLDGIDNTHIATSPCVTGEILTPPRLTGTAPTLTGTALSTAATGFYACINGANTAQLFLTGQTKTVAGAIDSQTNDSQVVARARDALGNRADENKSVSWSVKSLDGEYECTRTTSGTPPVTTVTKWGMRTDFGNDSTNPNNTTRWIQDVSNPRQPQPIEINWQNNLTVTSSAIGASSCNSIGNDGTNGTENLSTYPNDRKVPHTIDFKNPTTFNGDKDITAAGSTAYENPQVISTDPRVQFLKQGAIPLFGGYDGVDYDANNNGTVSPGEGDQPSLGKFLYDKHMAIIDPTNNTTTGTYAEKLNNPLTRYIIPTAAQLTADSNLTASQKDAFISLGSDQRIVAFEVGQKFTDKKNDGTAITGNKNPGFDLQDNIFIVTSDVFRTKFQPSCFSGGNCNPKTGQPNPPPPTP